MAYDGLPIRSEERAIALDGAPIIFDGHPMISDANQIVSDADQIASDASHIVSDADPMTFLPEENTLWRLSPRNPIVIR